MRIEMNAGGLQGAIAIGEFQLNFTSFISKADDVISSFKAVRSATSNLSGGVGTLRDAYDDINARITREEEKKAAAIEVRKKSFTFLDLAVRIDNQVARLVTKNRNEFYRVNPWLKPPVPESEKGWLEKGWDWLCDKGRKLDEALDKAWQWTKDTANKAWNGLVDFYEKHKKAIATALMIVAAAAVLVFASSIGGPFAAMAIGAAWGTISGAVIGGVSGGLRQKAEGGSFWEGFENGAFSGALAGAAGGALMGGIGFAGQALGNGVSALSTLGKAIKTTSTVSKLISGGMLAFDTAALADLAIDPSNNLVYDLNQKAHSSTMYNVVQVGAGAVAVFTGGMTKTMNTEMPPAPQQPAAGPANSGTDGFGDNINFEQDSMSNGRYFSRGNHYDEFRNYWETGGDQFNYTRTNDNSVQMISARDIEGVHVYQSDLNNPSQFWNGSGRYGESGYREFILNGKIQNTPVRVNKIITNNSTFYLFESDGRHRILTSQELGIDIPAIIEGIYTIK